MGYCLCEVDAHWPPSSVNAIMVNTSVDATTAGPTMPGHEFRAQWRPRLAVLLIEVTTVSSTSGGGV